jgi:hypothetical protein
MIWTADIYLYLYGVWRMMMGRRDGMNVLDVSADGFWNSFSAIFVALPALLVSWVSFANEAEVMMLLPGTRFQILIRLMIAGIGSWILPLAGLAAVAPRLKIGDRFVHYVVATNWASALLAWLMLPPTLLQILFPDLAEIAALFSLMLFFVSLFLSWRVTVAAIGKGPAVGTGVFFGMLIASMLALFALQSLLGIHASTL